jgi:type II secretory pathway component PulJ
MNLFKRQNSGFTLVEVFISMAIFVAVMVAVTTFLVDIYSNNRTVSGSFQTAQDAQVILKTMLTELRQSATAANGAYPIAVAGTSSITFFSNIDNDAQIEEVSYSFIGNTLYRAVIQPTGSPLTYNIASQSTSSMLTDVRNSSSTPVFQYYDQNYTGTSSPLSLPINIPVVRLIKISLSLDVLVNQAPVARTYTTQVSLRNLKTNL